MNTQTENKTGGGEAPRVAEGLGDDYTLPRVYVNGQTFEVLSEVNAELIIRRPKGSKQYHARRLGNEQIYGANRAQILKS